MVKIPTYQARNLASESTGIPQADRSGEVIGETVTQLAGKVMNYAADALDKQNALLRKAQLTKQVSQFDSDMAIASAEIRQQYSSNPDEGVKLLDTKRKELFEQYKGAITDQDVKLSFDAFGSESVAKGQALDRLWAFGENNKIIQQTHFDRITADADFAGKTDNFNDVLGKLSLLDANKEDFYKAWGGVLEGTRVIDAAQESIVKSYFYGQLDKGNAFKVLKEIEDGRLGPLEGTNGIISSEKLKGLKAQATKMALAGKEDGAALALVQAVQTNFDIDAALKEPVSSTEEKINSLSFEIGKKKALVASGEVAPEEVKVLEDHQKILESIRSAQLSRNDMYVVPDPEVEAEMTSQFLSLFAKSKAGIPLTNKPFKATLDEVFKFQQTLMENHDKISPALFKKYSLMVDKSFQSEIQGFVKGSKLQTKATWFGLGGTAVGNKLGMNPLEAVDKGRLSHSKKLQNTFSDMISTHDPKAGNKDLFETMKIFFDDLDERLDINDAPSLDAISQEQLTGLVEGAKRKMQLKKMGLPVYLGEKNVIYPGGVAYVITGFDKDGMPLVDPK